ncbi:MAG: DNA polymerase III subunit delta [Beijerinckiaceae bacterium]
MVAIKSHEAERFLARPAPHIFLYLVFGTDAGLVAERARRIIFRAVDDPKDPFQHVRIGGDELANDPARLADEANTIPLFGGRRAIWIEVQGKAFPTALEPLLRAPPRDCTIVIEAGALKKDAALRTLCERERNAAAIQCYPDTPKDIAQLIDAEVGAANLSIAPDAKAFLVSQLGQDRLSTRSELGKLVLYAHGAGEITLDHVAAIVCDASNLILNEAVDAVFNGGLAALDARLRHIFAGASDYHALLAAALRHALDLHRARRDAEDGPCEGSGFASAGFRQKESFERHLRAWTRPNLGRAIDTLGEAVLWVRREPKLGPSFAARALWTIAETARSKAATR